MDKNTKEEFKVSGEDILKKVKEIIKEGNVRKIIIKNEKGKEVITIPLTIGAVGVILAPALAAIGAVAALLTKCTIVVEKAYNKKL
jgi:repressor of nif and glnA expression